MRGHLPMPARQRSRTLSRRLLAVVLAGLLIIVTAPSAAQAAEDQPAPADLDLGFGTAGVVTTPNMYDGAESVVIQGDGKIAVVGRGDSPDWGWAVERYTSEGQLDPIFGRITTPWHTSAFPKKIMVQQDAGVEKLVVAVNASAPSHNGAFTLARYVDGHRDGSFGEGGIAAPDIFEHEVAESLTDAVVLPSTGAIVAVGGIRIDEMSFLAIVGYTVDGALDSGFGNGGVVLVPVGTAVNGAEVAVRSDGDVDTVVVAYDDGTSDWSAPSELLIARYTESGAFLSRSGATLTTMVPNDVAVDDEGGVLAVVNFPGSRNSILVRFGRDGGLDGSFGQGGVVQHGGDYLGGVAVEPAGTGSSQPGRIVAAGAIGGHVAVSRFTSRGVPDPNFGVGGTVVTSLSDFDWANEVAVQADGKIVVPSALWTSHDGAIVRYHGGDGSLVAAACADGVDNDGDGLVDFATAPAGDPGCESSSDIDETDDAGSGACGDGADNDGDGLVDFDANGGGDPGCMSVDDTDESNPVIPPGDCPEPKTVKSADGVLAAMGCFVEDGSRWLASGAVRVNGIDVTTNATVTVDPVNLRVSATGQALVKVGSFVLSQGPVSWSMGSPQTVRLPEGSRLFGFPIEGSATVSWANGASLLALSAKLPAALGGLSGNATLAADNPRGLHVESVGIKVAKVKLGVLDLKNLNITYKLVDNTWTGGGTVVLASGLEIEASLTFKDGEFQGGRVAVDGINAPLGGGLFLQRLGADVKFNPHFMLGGEVAISAGPQVQGKTAARLAGNVEFHFSDPRVVNAAGELTVGDLPFGTGKITANSNGLIAVEGNLTFGTPDFGVNGYLKGWVDETDSFNFEGGASINLIGVPLISGTAVVSTNGMAACGQAFGLVEVGIGRKWGGDAEVGGCDLGAYRDHPRALRSSGADQVTIGPGLPLAGFAFAGDSAAPAVTIRGPAGEVVIADLDHHGVSADGHLVTSNPKNNTTYVVLSRPTAGTWTIEPHKSSASLTRIRQADGLPEPKVAASVAPDGTNNPACLCKPGDQVLTWDLAHIPGQSVTFVEEGAAGAEVIGTTSAESGSFTFTPRSDAGSERRILATIEQDGLPRTNLVVATF